MDFAKKAQSHSDHSDNPTPTTNDPGLFSSAKVVAGAAQSQFRSEEYDREKAAGAGADLLNAASEYGKFDTTQGVGKYVDQAEGHLRQFSTKSAGTEIPEPDESAPAGDLKSTAADESSGLKSTFAATDAVKATSKDHSAADGDDSAGEVIKSTIPTGDANKTSGGGSGIEDYVKKAEGFEIKDSTDGVKEKKTGDYNTLKEDEEDALMKKVQPGEDAEHYAKEAEGILGKPSTAEDGGEKIKAASDTPSVGGGGGLGNVMKMAGGFLQK